MENLKNHYYFNKLLVLGFITSLVAAIVTIMFTYHSKRFTNKYDTEIKHIKPVLKYFNDALGANPVYNLDFVPKG